MVGCEVGGRCSSQALTLIRSLARYKAQSVPVLLRRSAELAWHTRWCNILAAAVHRSFAASLAGRRCPAIEGEEVPYLVDVLTDCRYAAGPNPSRLPARG